MMKFEITKSLAIIVLGLFLALMASCKPEDEEVTITSDVYGNAMATPSTVKNGDEINLSIGGVATASGSVIVDGKEYYPIVHYLIEGNEVAVSAEKEMPFNAIYKVENLTVGEHILSVSITPSFSRAQFVNKIVGSVITVVE